MQSYKQSGFIGLAPMNPDSEYPGFQSQSPVNFGVFLSDNPYKLGQLVFGAEDYDIDTYAQKGLKKDNAIWLDLARNRNYWTVNIKNMYMEDQELDLQGTDFIFDTGMSFGLIPINDFDTITTHLAVNYNCTWTHEHGYLLTTLTDDQYNKLPDLQVNFKRNENETVRINFPKESYMYGVNG